MSATIRAIRSGVQKYLRSYIALQKILNGYIIRKRETMHSPFEKYQRLRSRLTNWWMRPLERVGIIRGDITYRFRNGLQFTFQAVPKRTSLAIVEEVMFDKPYSNTSLRLNSGDVVVDIGANCGAFCVYQAHLVPGLEIHAYEPDPVNYKFLVKNIRENSSHFSSKDEMSQTIFAHQIAIVGDNHVGDVIDLYYNPEQMGSHTTESRIACGGARSVRVGTKRFSDILRDHLQKGITFLKIDCEGAEHDMFSYTDKDLFINVRFIALEYHEMQGREIPSLRKRLGNLGFRVDETHIPGIWHCWNIRFLSN